MSLVVVVFKSQPLDSILVVKENGNGGQKKEFSTSPAGTLGDTRQEH